MEHFGLKSEVPFIIAALDILVVSISSKQFFSPPQSPSTELCIYTE